MAERAYDLTVLLAPEIDFEQDGSRYGGGFRERQHAWYLRQLGARRIPFLLVTGALEDRVAQLCAALPDVRLPNAPACTPSDCQAVSAASQRFIRNRNH